MDAVLRLNQTTTKTSGHHWLVAAVVVMGCSSALWATTNDSPDSRKKPAPLTGEADWPCWRGPQGNNHYHGLEPPLRWSADSNVAWKSAVPGRGHASPCILGERIFIASADETNGTQMVLCYDRDNGKILWRTELHHGKLPAKNEKNSHASATPACDGKVLIVPFATRDGLWVTGISIDSDILWQKNIGRFKHANGYGSSPALFENLVIVSNDNQDDPSLVALSRADGEIAWKIDRPLSDNSATPVVANVAGRPQLLLQGAGALYSYNPASGTELWRVHHKTDIAANTVTFDEECVYASGNVPEKLLMAVRADGQGDVTESHVMWRDHQLNPYVTSPLVVDDMLFTIIDAGTAVCRDSRTGKDKWKHRLNGNFFASPVLAAGRIYAINEEGVTYVLKAGPNYQLIAENDIGEPCMATPAICRGNIYLRSASHLYCIGTIGEP